MATDLARPFGGCGHRVDHGRPEGGSLKDLEPGGSRAARGRDGGSQDLWRLAGLGEQPGGPEQGVGDEEPADIAIEALGHTCLDHGLSQEKQIGRSGT